jgi:hypothetical protein
LNPIFHVFTFSAPRSVGAGFICHMESPDFPLFGMYED